MGNFFELGSSLIMNVPEIDEQHSYLTGLINDYHASIRGEASREQLADILAFLVSYVGIHFSTEERLMEETSYPGGQAHAAEHACLTEKVAGMAALYETGQRPDEEQLAVFLRDWLVTHVGETDRKLADWIIYRKSPGA